MEKICGILCVTSRTIYGFDKKKIYKKLHTKKYDRVLIGIKKNNDYKTDMFVIAEVLEQKNDVIYCKINKLIGSIYNIDNEYEYIKSQYQIYYNKINYELSNITQDGIERCDLTNEYTISIDPYNCKDIDDALHIKLYDDGKYDIGIHIADVSKYVINNSELDIELFNRCESIYLSSEIINMLPDELLKICTLKNNEIKTVFSIIIDTDNNIKLQRSLIINKYNISYDDAEKLKNTDKLLNILYNHVKANNMHDMIEKYMIFANSYVTKYLSDDGIFRVHKGFKKNICDQFDSNIKDKIIKHNMHRAEYKVGRENIYHNGLNIQYYTHFTSPIRRYIDILVHRQIDNIQISNLHNKINIINNKKKEYTKLYYKELQLNLKKNINETEIYTNGIIIGFVDNKIILYVGVYNCELLAKMYSKKIIKIVNINELELGYEIIYDNKNIHYYLGNEMNIVIYKTHKLKVKIV